jgi:arabinogalactan endo-1,4-beta-galactosidase
MSIAKPIRLLALLATCAIACAQTPSPENAKPATPNSNCPRMALGADVSFLPQAEAQGTVFHDNGVAGEGLEILGKHGYQWVRLRLFNDPKSLPNDLAYTLAEAKRAKAMGFGLLLDFHYSDDWADPAHQITPVAWQKLNHHQLVDAVYAYTRDTIAKFRDEGVLPNIVQVGNEETSGMLWPDGKLPDNWPNFIELLAAAIRGVNDGSVVKDGSGAKNSSGAQRRPLIMLHIDKGGDIEATRWFFSHIVQANIPFDVIGQSYYPWWDGSLTDLRANLAFMAREYRKPIIIVETAYSWRPDNYIKKKGPYPETPEGQSAFLQALWQTVAETPNGLGRGIFWWEPAVRGPLARRGLFDDDGNSLPALHVFDACRQ